MEVMELVFAEKKKIGQIAGLFGALCALVIMQISPSQAIGIARNSITQVIKNPTAAVQTVRSLIPFTGPLYMATNPTQTINGVKNFWNYLFN